MAVSPYADGETASGARAVQIVSSSRRGAREIEHIGSAHDDAELETLKAVARQRLLDTWADGQAGRDAGGDGHAHPSVETGAVACLPVFAAAESCRVVSAYPLSS
ncbi:hypothetical protein Mth01_42500 [Sphaerimonospora thailandensis]|uniref:Uncharacterized protein n=1 Tax=Sphaerimonospora thailandensis TaxID=795644 RepID=A0A8J3RDS5_9ACTN|nr:hypothetical protein Mth01_42500 [Sphaerimonospora thailandensis]